MKAIIQAELLPDCKSSRVSLNAKMSDATLTTADLVKKEMDKKNANLLLDDPSFKIEVALVNWVVDGSGESRLHVAMVECLPTHAKRFSPESVAQKLSALGASGLFKLSARGVQGHLKVAQKLIASLVADECPSLAEADKDPLMQKFIDRLGNFCTNKDSKGDVIVGVEAARLYLVQAEHATKTGCVTHEHITPLKKFKFLFEADDINRIAQVLKDADPKAKAKAVPKVKASSSAASSSGQSKQEKLKDEEQSVAMKKALDMFKKTSK